MRSSFIKISAALLAGSLLMFTLKAAAEEVVSPLTVVTVNGQNILADAHGMTAYVYDKDTAGASNCTGACAKAWPPILSTNQTVATPLGIITRADGTKQITYDGKPVYLYVGDQNSGDISGDGLGNVWHIVKINEN